MEPPVVSVFEILAKRLLNFYFKPLKKIDNYRPDWLAGLELDRFYPEIKVGIEFQGIQHFRPTEELGQTREQFSRQLEKDTLKRRLCEKGGVTLFTLGLSALTQGRFKRNFQRIAEVGIRNAQGAGNQRVVHLLKSTRFNRNPHPEILRRLNGIGKG